MFFIGANNGFYKTAYIGFKNKNYAVLVDEFKRNSHELLISTEDGSLGYKGFVTDLLAGEKQNKIRRQSKIELMEKV